MKMFALLSCLLFWPTVVCAEALPVVCQEFPPYNYIGEDGSVTGTSTEILIAVLKRMGYKADIQLLPWNRAYHRAAFGEAAILYTFSKSAQREDHFFFTDGLASIEVVFFKRKSDCITWEELTDVKDLRIGYVDGYNYGGAMMEALRQNLFSRTDVIGASALVDYQQLQKLVRNRIDLAVCPKTQCSRIIKMKEPELDELDFIDKPIGPPREFYAGFSKRWPGAESLRDRFNEAYRSFVEEGRKARIFEKYGLDE